MNEPTQSVFEVVLARPVDRSEGTDAQLVELSWRAPVQGARVVQAYVDGQLHDVTPWSDSRSMWLLLDRRHCHRIELLAVPATEATDVWMPRPDYLSGWSRSVQDTAALTLVRDQTLPVDTQIEVAVDDNRSDVGALWPRDTARSGFGAVFGEGGFGVDAATGPGLGRGELGVGPLGSDGSRWRWRHTRLSEGEHIVTLTARNHHGEPVANALSRSVTIARLPRPPASVSTDEAFTLHWRAG